MLNGRVVLFGIFCILFVAAAFGQDSSDTNIITVTKKIDVAKLDENVEKLNENVKTLTDTLEKLNKNVDKLTITVGNLEKTVTKLEERTGIMLNLQYIILAGIFGPLLYSIYQNNKNKIRGEATSTQATQTIESDTASAKAAQENQSEIASTNSQGEPASTSTSPSGFSEEEELLEQLKDYSPATEENA